MSTIVFNSKKFPVECLDGTVWNGIEKNSIAITFHTESTHSASIWLLNNYKIKKNSRCKIQYAYVRFPEFYAKLYDLVLNYNEGRFTLWGVKSHQIIDLREFIL